MFHGLQGLLVIRSTFGWAQHYTFILASSLDIRSACIYCQLSLDKMWTLKAGSSVLLIIERPSTSGRANRHLCSGAAAIFIYLSPLFLYTLLCIPLCRLL